MEEYRRLCRWEDNIETDLKEMGVNTRNRFDSAQDRDYYEALVNAALNLRFSQATELVSYYPYRNWQTKQKFISEENKNVVT